MADSSSYATAPSREGPPSPRASCRTPTIISRGVAARSSGRALSGVKKKLGTEQVVDHHFESKFCVEYYENLEILTNVPGT
ncbi:hypothetical protein M0R45_009362 [Rubus argutus]|uniref:Uncharacterized protein n=1 Tax=Rubus argutus TaxID=59490 RepID=A0AAW1Y5M0_RUBAR